MVVATMLGDTSGTKVVLRTARAPCFGRRVGVVGYVYICGKTAVLSPNNFDGNHQERRLHPLQCVAVALIKVLAAYSSVRTYSRSTRGRTFSHKLFHTSLASLQQRALHSSVTLPVTTTVLVH